MPVLAPPLPGSNSVTAANLAVTPILDHDSRAVRGLAELLARGDCRGRLFAQTAHRHLASAVRPVYTLDEHLPASAVLARGRGSCSQRMACLEAVCRARGVPTRVRALWVDGRFWYPRFRLARPFIPPHVLLAWPQLHLDGAWTDFDELYAPAGEMAARHPGRFTNDGETLFEAVRHTAVDFLGKSAGCGPVCDAAGGGAGLSSFVIRDDGFFDTRDELFARLGTLRRTVRGTAFEAVFGGRKSV
jgi:hypothetical protein